MWTGRNRMHFQKCLSTSGYRYVQRPNVQRFETWHFCLIYVIKAALIFELFWKLCGFSTCFCEWQPKIPPPGLVFCGELCACLLRVSDPRLQVTAIPTHPSTPQYPMPFSHVSVLHHTDPLLTSLWVQERQTQSLVCVWLLGLLIWWNLAPHSYLEEMKEEMAFSPSPLPRCRPMHNLMRRYYAWETLKGFSSFSPAFFLDVQIPEIQILSFPPFALKVWIVSA